MTTLLAVFCIALILSLVLTPMVGRIGTRFGAIDVPNGRKVHANPIPRTGGLSIVIVFLFALFIASFFNTSVSNLLVINRQAAFLLLGAMVCFGIGLLDDFHRQRPGLKFAFQIVAASIAYFGGINISSLNFLGAHVEFGFLSYFLTVFWFVLFINAVNLVDGLDGLAGGIVVFASLVMVILLIWNNDYMTAMLFTALGGSILGFLRYNFNPASIFLGDGGSYFLGYAIAGLSIMGSIKSQMSAAILIPLLALGIPLFDTILSPLRRFARGRKMFHPDTGHVHHRLVKLGFNAKNTVWIIYAITFCLCLLAVVVVNIRDEKAGFFLIILGLGIVIFVRKLGYFEYIAYDKIYGWFKDLTDEAGITHQRRTFLNIQIETGSSKNLTELWQNITKALDMLEFEYAALYMNYPIKYGERNGHYNVDNLVNGPDRRKTSYQEACVSMRNESPVWDWTNGKHGEIDSNVGRSLFRIELPLIIENNLYFGSLLLVKDVTMNTLTQYTLRRVEQLRRTINSTLKNLKEKDALNITNL